MSRTVDLSLARRQTSLSIRDRLGLLAAAVRGTTVGPFSLKDPAAHEEYRRYSALSEAGIYVTEEEAFTYSAVWDAVLQISSDTAKVPLVLFKRDGNQRAPYVESPVYRLLHDEPNAEQNAMVFRRTITAHALTAGNGYAEIERDRYNRPAALHLLTPNRVRPVRNRTTKALEYEVDGGRTHLTPQNVLHIQGLSYDGLEGYDVIDKARRAIGIAIANEKFAARFFGNGMTFGGLLTTDEPLDDPDDRREIREEIEKTHQGADKAHRLLVLGGGWSFTRFGVDPNKAQMKETREMQAIAVANFFNIPLHKIKSLERATNNNIEHQDLEYYKGCLLTWYTLWEQEANRKMVSRLEYRRQYFKHTVKGFLRADTKTQNESLAVQRVNGVINADEWRELEDLNPLPGGQGQIYIVQSGFVPLDSIKATADANLEKLKQPPPAPNPPPAAPGDDPNDDPDDDADDDAEDDVRAALRTELAAAQAEVGRLSLLIAGADAREASLREQVGAVEARGMASAEEIGSLRSQLEAQALTVAALREAQQVAEQQVAAITADRDALEARVREVGEAHALAEIAVRHAESRAEAAEADLALRAADLAAAAERLAEAEREAQHVRAVTAAQIAAVEAAGGDQAAEIVRLAGALQEATGTLESTQRELQEARDAHAAAVSDVGAVRAEVVAATARLEAAIAEAQAREATLQASHQATVEGLEANLRTQADTLRETAHTATSLEEQVQDLQADVAARDAAARVAAETLRAYEQRVADLNGQVAQALAQCEELRAAAGVEASALVAQIEAVRTEHAAAAARHEELTVALAAAVAGQTDAQAKVGELTRAFDAAQEQLAQMAAMRTEASGAAAAAEASVAELTAALETLRAAHAAEVAERETTHREALANLAVAIEARTAEEARVADLTTQLTDAQAALTQATADLAEERAVRAAAALVAREEASALVAAAQAEAETLRAAAQQAEAAVTEERQQIVRLTDALERATAEIAGRVPADVVEQRIAAATAPLQAALDQATAAADAARRTAEEHDAALRAARETIDDAQARLALADDTVADAQKRAEALQAGAAAAEALARTREAQAAEAVEARSQAVDRLIATIAAQRGVLVDAWGRMARRAASQARTKQATPDKLRRWLEAFPTLHEAICLEAVLPAVRLHLATCGKADDPATVATGLVREHITSLQRVVRYALDAAPEDFHAEFERLMARWEVDEPAAMADRLITEEIRDARR